MPIRERQIDVPKSLYILQQPPPPLGNPRGCPKPQVWGTIGSGLTPRVQKRPQGVRFPALISVGAADRFLEDLSPDIPRNQFFGKYVETKDVRDVKLGWFKGLSDIQGHLGQAQGVWNLQKRSRSERHAALRVFLQCQK